MAITKYLAIAASSAFILGVAPAYAQTTYQTFQTETERGYTANPPGPGAPQTAVRQPTRAEVEATKRTAESEIQDHAQVSGADTRAANQDIAAGDQLLAENRLPEAQRFYRAAMSAIENPHSMSMGTHATVNNPNISGTNGMQK